MTIKTEDYYYTIILERKPHSWGGMSSALCTTATLSSEALDGTQVYGPIRTGNIKINDGATIGTATDADAITIASAGAVTFSQRDVHSAGITIANDGQIGSAGDADSIAISSAGVVTFSQNPVFPTGGVNIASLDIDGGTDIGEAIVDADLFIVDNGAGGTNRKVAASRIKTTNKSWRIRHTDTIQ